MADAEAATASPLLRLSEDEVEVILNGLSDVLRPHIACALAAVCKMLRPQPVLAVLAQLRRGHEAARALLLKMKHPTQGTEDWLRAVAAASRTMRCEELAEATKLQWNHRDDVTTSDMQTLAMIIKKHGLPNLELLDLHSTWVGACGMAALSSGLGAGSLPRLTKLDLDHTSVGRFGASALAAALGRGALPKLEWLGLGDCALQDPGLEAVWTALRQRPALKTLVLSQNYIVNLHPLLDNLGESELKQLETLYLDTGNEINDDGCAALVAVIDSGALPALTGCSVEDCLASDDAVESVFEAIERNNARRGE